MTLVDTTMRCLCGYNYCDGQCISGCLQWCFLIVIYSLCKLGCDDDD